MYTLLLRKNTPRILYDFEVVSANESSDGKNNQPKPIEKWANVYQDSFRNGGLTKYGAADMLLKLANTKKQPTNDDSNTDGEKIFDETEIVKVIAMIDTGDKFSTIVQKLKDEGRQGMVSKYRRMDETKPTLPEFPE